MNSDQDPAVQQPNSRPTASEFETSDMNYVAGFPEVPEPDWMMTEADKFAESRRARSFGKMIETEVFWYGKTMDTVDIDLQNGINPLFEP
jgi:hypothetical protein